MSTRFAMSSAAWLVGRGTRLDAGRVRWTEPSSFRPTRPTRLRGMRLQSDRTWVVTDGLAYLHPHALHVREFLDRRTALHAAVPGRLDPAVGHGRVPHLVRVDPHLSGAERPGGAVGD